MAPAVAGDFIPHEDDDDFFVEYNPHPYRGGYDIAATFGTPLPPSANICYPVSSSAAASVPTVPSPPSPTPEPEEPRGDEEAPREPVQESPEVFPNGASTKGKVRRGGWCGRGFWRKCVRGLDYLFGYKDPYAEQRIGVDSYVVPVYANRKQSGENALAVEVEVAPPAVGRVEPHDGSEELVQSNELSWHSNYRDEANSYSQSMSNSYYTPFAQSYGLPGVLGKPDWFPNFSYSKSHQVEEFQHEALSSYDVEHMISGHPIYCYHHHCYKQALNVQVEPTEPVSSQSLEYYEHFSKYCDQSDVHILETPAHACNIQSYTPTFDVPLEPFKPSWSQIWGLYDAYMQGDALENDSHSVVSGEYGGIGSLFISPFYPRETEIFDQAPGDELASFQHNRHNLSYRNVYIDDVPLITQQAEDSYSMNGSFWPFGEHSAYNV
ncbi:hypothetical protein SEVIR_9G421000v4 [Setaria viridis]|uniref:Uncharacterized protein n=1 Tax=Setaria viridis TaxID=4556 RepID=A0A4U6T804_SETVI|nr:uncharacterized protein LOC117836693 isoform X1 [Setaria viridis]TKV96322.1 hypothetical protein SEVIR_9G421000v2 [Setaria viridis]